MSKVPKSIKIVSFLVGVVSLVFGMAKLAKAVIRIGGG